MDAPDVHPPAVGPALEDTLERHRRSLEDCVEKWGCRLEGLVVDLASALEATGTRPVWKGDARGTPGKLPGSESKSSDPEAEEEVGEPQSHVRSYVGAAPSIDLGRMFDFSWTSMGSIGAKGIFASCFKRFQMKLLQPPCPIPGLLGQLVSSKDFEALSALIIVANAIYIAYASDLEIDQIGSEEVTITSTWLWVEIAFTAWYALELAMRVAVFRMSFLLCKDWSWNLFDTVLVLVSLQDIVMSVGTANPAFLRIMRLARMLKLLRVIRLLRIFRELRLILNAILSCMKTMFWAALLILNVSFIFGLCFLQATADYLREQGDGLDEAQKESLLRYWGSCSNSMYSLYAAALGGIDWDRQANTLRPVGSLFFLLFLVYVGFFYCVITNTLTSLFVEATMANAQKDQQEVIQAELEQKEVYVRQLRRLFLSFGGQDSGEITLQDFMSHNEDPEMIWFASQLGVEMVDVKHFFSVLSSGGQMKVNLEAFVVGCIRLKGAAKSMDLMDMKLTLEQESGEVRQSLMVMERKIEAVASAIDAAGYPRSPCGRERGPDTMSNAASRAASMSNAASI